MFGTHIHLKYLEGGGAGVPIFFALSGFLITTILLLEISKKNSIDVLRFYFRRILRLWPALVVMVGVVGLYCLVAFKHQPGFRHTSLIGSWWALTYSGNWNRALHGPGLAIFGHTWSLAVEEQFYLVWPILFVGAFFAFGRRGVFGVAVVGALASIGLKIALAGTTGASERLYNGTDTAADQLLFGCALATLFFVKPKIVKSVCSALVIPSLVIIFAVITQQAALQFLSPYTQSVVALSATFVIGFLVTSSESRLSRLLSVAPLAYLGRISYGFYLWHAPIRTVVGGHVSSYFWMFSLTLLLSLATASASYHFVEQPILKWRDRRTLKLEERDEGLTVATHLMGNR